MEPMPDAPSTLAFDTLTDPWAFEGCHGRKRSREDVEHDSDTETLYESDDHEDREDREDRARRVPRARTVADKRALVLSVRKQDLSLLWCNDFGRMDGRDVSGAELFDAYFMTHVRNAATGRGAAGRAADSPIVHVAVHLMRAECTGQLTSHQKDALMDVLHDYRKDCPAYRMVAMIVQLHRTDPLFTGLIFKVIRTLSQSASAAFLHGLLNATHLDGYHTSLLAIQRVSSVILGIDTLPELVQWIWMNASEDHNRLQIMSLHRTIDGLVHAMTVTSARTLARLRQHVGTRCGFLRTLYSHAHADCRRATELPQELEHNTYVSNPLSDEAQELRRLDFPSAELVALEYALLNDTASLHQSITYSTHFMLFANSANSAHSPKLLHALLMPLVEWCASYHSMRRHVRAVDAVYTVLRRLLLRHAATIRLHDGGLMERVSRIVHAHTDMGSGG